MPARRLLAGLLLATALTACNDDAPQQGFEGLDEAGASAAPTDELVETAPSPTTPSQEPDDGAADVDLSEVPDPVTEAYAQQVLDELFASSGAIVAEVLASPPNGMGALPAGTDERVADLFERGGFDFAFAELESFAATEEARAGLLPAADFTGIRHDVVELTFAGPGCIIAVTRTDTSGSVPDGGPAAALSAVSLARHDGTVDTDHNPTPWRVAGTLSNNGPDGPNPDEVMLEATLGDFDGVLDNDCTAEDRRAS